MLPSFNLADPLTLEKMQRSALHPGWTVELHPTWHFEKTQKKKIPKQLLAHEGQQEPKLI
jgi:hypothetical protein